MIASSSHATHEVLNQPAPLVGYNAFTQDRALMAAVEREGAAWAFEQLAASGAAVGSERVQYLARQANRHAPELRSYDRFGRRIDQVEFHPAYHDLMALVFGAGVHSLAWTAKRPGAHVARGALSYLWNQAENGVNCPTSMVFGTIPVLRLAPALAARWEPQILSTHYDPRPIAPQDKLALTVGVSVTEKQGGSDLRATMTEAAPDGGDAFRLTGHKWFFSAPMSDLFFTLARTAGGLTCFLVPGWLSDGTRNRVEIQRLKDKCGNRSNASSEIELRGALAWRVGEEGRGIATVIQMMHLTRLDYVAGSGAIMRQALSQALHHCAGRRVFQRPLIDQSAMRNVLADLAVESEAAMLLAFRLFRAYDRNADETERLFGRIGTPLGKYWVCKRTPAFVAEALECHGGNGFIEDHLMARLYREAPLNGIWEGTSNVICLDVLRAMRRAPASVDAYLDEVKLAKGGDRRLDAFVADLEQELTDFAAAEGHARRTCERMVLALQASLLVRHAFGAVADAFCASRLGAWSGAFGTLPGGTDQASIVERAHLV